MKYLFWNTNRKENINGILAKLINEYKCDIIGLAEYKDNLDDLLRLLSNIGLNLYHVPQIGCQRIQILTRFPPEKINHFRESDYYTIKGMPHETLGYHFVAFVHFPSKLNKPNPIDLTTELLYLRMDLEKVELDYKNRNSLIVGDFNVNPFEEAMISAIACHSLPSRDVVKKSKRVILGREYFMFYNPMWNMFGDISSPPGTYYYNASIQNNYYWNIFDQVIIRPEIIENFDLSDLKIITEFDNIKLLNRNNIPIISDHLPIFFTIN